MNESPISPALDAAVPVMPPAPAAIDRESEFSDACLPHDHPSWQRDVISMSTRARALAAAVVPIVVRALSFWDHRIREIAFGARTFSVDPAGCYRFR